uniref:Uncharacterized protein n=1 Tax=Rhizophora mucronata TaxID=61149 RepID=A0A2P2P1L9_RHIMU
MLLLFPLRTSELQFVSYMLHMLSCLLSSLRLLFLMKNDYPSCRLPFQFRLPRQLRLYLQGII